MNGRVVANGRRIVMPHGRIVTLGWRVVVPHRRIVALGRRIVTLRRRIVAPGWVGPLTTTAAGIAMAAGAALVSVSIAVREYGPKGQS